MFWLVAIPLALFGALFLTTSNWARERRAAEAAREALEALRNANASDVPDAIEFGARFTTIVAEHFDRSDASSLMLALGSAASGLHALEGFAKEPPPEPARYDSLDGVKYMEQLRRLRRKLTDRGVLERFAQKTFEASVPILLAAPADPVPGVSFSVTLASAVPDLNKLVEEIVLSFFDPVADEDDLFRRVREQLEHNVCIASGFTPDQFRSKGSKLVLPTKYRGPDVVQMYLRGTPYLDVFDATIDLVVPDASRFEHMHVVAGTGHGKTQTLQHFILHDLNSEAGLVVIDSQGEMLRKIAQLHTDKELIYIDPTDLAHPPGLNMFDVSRLEGLPAVKREQFLNGLIELLEYVFAGLLRAELTQKQNVLFRYTLRLMLAVPGATILDLLRCLAEPTAYLKHAKSLNPMAREFLEREFLDRSYTQTRDQIRRRLYGVLENDAFRRMFSAKQSSIDVAAALNRGAVLLVDTAKSHLKSDASALMGRYFIALTLQAALEREGSQRPAFLYIDEAGEYFDDNIDTLLNEARKRRVGIVMAHQYLDQLTPQLRSSIATNTSIKLAGGVSDKDARSLAADMRTTPETIAAQRKGHFVCFVKNVTPSAVSIEVPFGRMEALPKQPLRLAHLSPRTSDAGLQPHDIFDDPEVAAVDEPEPASASDSSEVDLTPTRDW